MRVFLYEFITGGGMWSDASGQLPGGSLLAEGAAMFRALASDLAAIDDVQVVALFDSRISPQIRHGDVQLFEVDSRERELDMLASLAASSDATILIAPEFDDLLLQRCQLVESLPGRLISPNSRFIKIAANKQTTCERLSTAGIRVPYGQLLTFGEQLPQSFCFPAVVKPVCGAGSINLRYVANREQLESSRHCGSRRIETYCPGYAASVALLCGLQQVVPLEPCEQRLSDDGQFRYLGGATPLPEDLRERASKLAMAVMEVLPTTIGYVGVDLVLGNAANGSEDVVVEVNPRLTTSYVGLRRLCQNNLAKAMLDIAEGRETELLFGRDRIEFAPIDGC